MTSLPLKVEIGREVRALCGKCKTETIHVITKLADDVIKKVYCKICNNNHVYKTLESIKQAETRKATKKTTATKTKVGVVRRKKDWATLVSAVNKENIVDYDFTKDFTETEAIRHTRFGVGVITQIVDRSKIEVVFQDELKVLAHNWLE